MPKQVQTRRSVSMSRDVYCRLKALAEAEQTSMASIVSEMIEHRWQTRHCAAGTDEPVAEPKAVEGAAVEPGCEEPINPGVHEAPAPEPEPESTPDILVTHQQHPTPNPSPIVEIAPEPTPEPKPEPVETCDEDDDSELYQKRDPVVYTRKKATPEGSLPPSLPEPEQLNQKREFGGVFSL